MLGLILVGFGLICVIVSAIRYWSEEENLTLGRDTPAKQASRAARRRARYERDVSGRTRL